MNESGGRARRLWGFLKAHKVEITSYILSACILTRNFTMLAVR